MPKKTTLKIEQKELDDIKKMSDDADQTRGFQLSFYEDLEEDGFNTIQFNDTQNPDQAYQIYYSIERMLKDNLPKGEDNAKVREIVREEKNVFLNRGKEKDNRGIRGSDPRQAYILAHLKVAFDIVALWIREGGTTFDLYMKFREENQKNGYREKVKLSNSNKKLLKEIGYDLKKVKKQRFQSGHD